MIEKNEIIYWDLEKKCYEVEKIYSKKFLTWMYSNNTINRIFRKLLIQKFLNTLYGIQYDTYNSTKKIKPFIEKFNINMNDFENTKYNCFNDFFSRKLKPNARVFSEKKEILSAFAEGKYLVFENIQEVTKLPIKDAQIDLKQLFDNHKIWESFIGGTCYIARLCLNDYHRYHYFDSGITNSTYIINGSLNSVSPIALSAEPDLLFKNERRVSLLKTDHFQEAAMIEVGALTVGKIIQTFNEEEPFTKGTEKGTFKIGASTVILILKSGQIKPNKTILEQTQKGFETYIKLGTEIGCKSN